MGASYITYLHMLKFKDIVRSMADVVRQGMAQ